MSFEMRRRSAQRGSEEAEATHPPRSRMTVATIRLQQRRVGEQPRDQRVQYRLGIIPRTNLPIQLEPLTPFPQLRPRLQDLIHRLEVDKVVLAPRLPLILLDVLERLEDVEHHHMIAGAVHKLLASEVGRLTSGSGVDEEVVARAEEGEKVDHVGGAAFGEGSEKDSCEDGLEREGGHLATEGSDAAFGVDGGETVQSEESGRDCEGVECELGAGERMTESELTRLLRRPVHEVKLPNILLSSSEEMEDGESETDALDLGFGRLVEVEEVLLGVEAEADTSGL